MNTADRKLQVLEGGGLLPNCCVTGVLFTICDDVDVVLF